MSSKTFQIVFGAGMMMADGRGGSVPFGGELVFYRSTHPIRAGREGLYSPAPGSDEEVARVAVRQFNGHPVSAPVTLEATCAREVGALRGDKPRAVYSCVHIQGGHESFIKDGFIVPESLREQTTWGAVAVASVLPEDRGCTVEEAEGRDPLKRITEAARV